MNNKGNSKTIFIAIMIFGVFLISIVIYNIFKDNEVFDESITFSLIGNSEVNLDVGETYQEQGIRAILKNGQDIKNKVVIKGNIDVNKVGKYVITYTLVDNKGNSKVLKRTVNVSYKDKLLLNGKSDIYILLGGIYNDEGVVAYYNNTNYSDKVIVNSNVDYNKSGDYTISYILSEMSNGMLNRNIHVSEFDDFFKISYDNSKTNKNIELKILVDLDKVSKYTLPSNEEKTEATTTYEINANGTYNFVIYDKYNNKYNKIIVIDNIDTVLPMGSCHATISANKTVVTVNADKAIKQYYYNGNESINNVYTFNAAVKSVSVKLVDEVNNEITINCDTSVYSENMEMHFIASGHYDDAILIRTDDKVIFIDGGRYNCRTKVTPYIKALGVSHIDAVIGSHIQNNHIAMQADILANFTVDKFYYADDIFTCASRGSCIKEDQDYIVNALKNYNKIPEIVKPGRLINIGEMSLYFLAPHRISTSQNNNSLIFILKFRNNTFMFTGDAGTTIMNINRLKEHTTQFGIGLKVDMLKYPHHGNQSLDDDFLKATSPSIVIVPNYKAPSYPNSSNASKIKKYAKMYRQSDYENILLLSNGNTINVLTKVSASTYHR